MSNPNKEKTNLEDHIEILEENSMPQNSIGIDEGRDIQVLNIEKSEEVLEAIGGEETMFTSLKSDISAEEHKRLCATIKNELGYH